MMLLQPLSSATLTALTLASLLSSSAMASAIPAPAVPKIIPQGTLKLPTDIEGLVEGCEGVITQPSLNSLAAVINHSQYIPSVLFDGKGVHDLTPNSMRACLLAIEPLIPNLTYFAVENAGYTLFRDGPGSEKVAEKQMRNIRILQSHLSGFIKIATLREDSTMIQGPLRSHIKPNGESLTPAEISALLRPYTKANGETYTFAEIKDHVRAYAKVARKSFKTIIYGKRKDKKREKEDQDERKLFMRLGKGLTCSASLLLMSFTNDKVPAADQLCLDYNIKAIPKMKDRPEIQPFLTPFLAKLMGREAISLFKLKEVISQDSPWTTGGGLDRLRSAIKLNADNPVTAEEKMIGTELRRFIKLSRGKKGKKLTDHEKDCTDVFAAFLVRGFLQKGGFLVNVFRKELNEAVGKLRGLLFRKPPIDTISHERGVKAIVDAYEERFATFGEMVHPPKQVEWTSKMMDPDTNKKVVTAFTQEYLVYIKRVIEYFTINSELIGKEANGLKKRLSEIKAGFISLLKTHRRIFTSDTFRKALSSIEKGEQAWAKISTGQNDKVVSIGINGSWKKRLTEAEGEMVSTAIHSLDLLEQAHEGLLQFLAVRPLEIAKDDHHATVGSETVVGRLSQ